MDIIKELCAFLPRTNSRGVWQEFGMRDYLSVLTWVQHSRVESPHKEYIDFHFCTKNPDMPGGFTVRTNWICTEVVGVYNFPIKCEPELEEKRALLFDLTFTENLAFRLGKSKVLSYPDAGSW